MNKNIQKLRTKINNIDAKILELLSERFEISKKIGREKKKSGLPLYDPKRELTALKKRQITGIKSNIDLKFVNKLFRLIFKYSKKVQKAQK